MRGLVFACVLVAVLAAAACNRSPAGLHHPAVPEESGDLEPAIDPDLPWLGLNRLHFQGFDETSQSTYDLVLEGIGARYWPNPEFAPGPNWNPPVRWLQFIHQESSSGADPNQIEGAGRIQETPQGIFGLGKITASVIGTYTTPNGTERIAGTLIFDLAEDLIVPIKGGSFFEPCGTSCIDLGVRPLFDPDPNFNRPPGFLTGDLIGRLTPTFASISAGAAHTCALTAAGTAYCWGRNGFGELGDGTNTDRNTPVAVAGGHTFTAISTEEFHTCGLNDNGIAYCWGFNQSGQLGDGTDTNRNTPVAVAGLRLFTALGTGYRHTCAVTTAEEAYCWGWNLDGQLGDGTNTDRNTPVAVAGGFTFADISGGGVHTCGLTTVGDGYCWGSNFNGQLGDGTNTDRNTPIVVAGRHIFADISAGIHTCSATIAGDAYCWGRNSHGELGDGTNTNRNSPIAVAGGITFADISAGFSQTCGLTPAGDAYCWGSSRLGDGTISSSNTPVAVVGGYTFTAISTGGHICALTAAGRAYCWGGNSSGQLGDGTNSESLVPVLVDWL